VLFVLKYKDSLECTFVLHMKEHVAQSTPSPKLFNSRQLYLLTQTFYRKVFVILFLYCCLFFKVVLSRMIEISPI